jgi:hypothetical protein
MSADVVQQCSEAELLQWVHTHAHEPPKRQRQRADVHAVGDFGLVERLEAAQQHQRIGVAHDAAHHVRDDGLGFLGVERLAQADVVEDLGDVIVRAGVDGLGVFDFVLEALDVGLVVTLGDARCITAGLGQQLLAQLGIGQVAFVEIDVSERAALAHVLEFGLVADLEALEQEVRLEPRPVELGDEHADLQLFAIYLDAHRVAAAW